MALQRVFNRNIGLNLHSPRLVGPVQDWQHRGATGKTGIIPGGAACPGCGENKAIDLAIQAIKLLGKIPILVISTGCPEVCNMPAYPTPIETIMAMGRLTPEQALARLGEFAPWAGTNKFDCPTIHLNFESAAATATGVLIALETMIEDGFFPPDKYVILVVGGDGAIKNIAFGTVCGAGDGKANIKLLEVMNGWYGNTGFQVVIAGSLKGAQLAYGAWGELAKGVQVGEKEMFESLLSSGYEYVASASPIFPADFIAKIQKAALINAPGYVQAACYCPQGSGTPAEDFFRIPGLQLASRMFQLMEAEVLPGTNTALYTLNFAPDRFVPVGRFFAGQKPYRKLLADPELVAGHQRHVDNKWRFWSPVFKANGLPTIAADTMEALSV